MPFIRPGRKKGVVLQNLLFPDADFPPDRQRFTPVELADNKIFNLTSDHVFRSNLDEAALQAYLEKDADKVAFACIELSDNAAGGHPVSLEHLGKLKTILSQYQLPLVIDGTRVLENARYLIEQEPACAGKSTWQLARELLGHGDAVIVSLAKDFCINKGGLVATNDQALHKKIQAAFAAARHRPGCVG